MLVGVASAAKAPGQAVHLLILQRAFRGAGAERVTMATDEAALWLAAAVGA